MRANHMPYVNYTTFIARVQQQNWSLYQAVHTPAKTRNRDRDRRRKAWWISLWERVTDLFINLFKRWK